jgi:hypothetical protein
MEPVSRVSLITGRLISGFIILFMLLDGVLHAIRFGPYVEGTVKVGFPASTVLPLGIVALFCTILYVIPRTAVLGAILLTGYFGGATATHVRMGQPFYFPLVFGILTWLGLYLRDGRLRELVPLRK